MKKNTADKKTTKRTEKVLGQTVTVGSKKWQILKDQLRIMNQIPANQR